jgi:UDP-N-acetylglucosamine--N-acetylmuramyl-(pentapeptide) pyrophosphoryl-undecaprenol N-acetylglucosamine transferase
MATFALAGGGTGGHVYPALAIGDVLRARGHTVLYYGDPDRLEARVAPERGYAFRVVRMRQYPRGGLLGKIRFFLGLAVSTWRTRRQLRADDIDAVIGVGSYISAPVVLAAWSLGRGTAIHEANAVPGLANKLCAKVSRVILVTFERTLKYLRGNTHVVGVPVNPKVLGGDRADGAARYGLDPARPIVVFVGGSLGALRLNELAVACARDPGRDYQIVHLCGPRYHGEIVEKLGSDVLPDYTLRDYEDQMGLAYAAADLVVCRAGSATLAELCAVGRGSLLIPSPNVTENHQEENARSLEALGAALVVPERDWDEAGLVAKVKGLVADRAHVAAMGEAARKNAKLDAAERAADLVETVL